MTLAEAEALGFNITMLPPAATELIETVRKTHASTGREAVEFEHEIVCGKLTFKLHCLGLKPRAGVIAPEMKKRKKEKDGSVL